MSLLYITESHIKAQSRIFAMNRKKYSSTNVQVETSEDAEESGSLLEYLDSLLIAVANLNTDISRLRVVAEQNNTVDIKSLSELPKVNVTDLKKLLQNVAVINNFKSNKTELTVKNDIKEKKEEIKKLGKKVLNNNILIQTVASSYTVSRPEGVLGRDSHQWTINKNLRAILKDTFQSVYHDILPALSNRMELLSNKLEQLKVSKMVGGGCKRQRYELKYDPIYQYP